MTPTKTTYTYPSRTEGAPYTVTVTAREGSAQVAVRCTCPPFRFTRWNECWHALDVVKRERLTTVVGCVIYNHPLVEGSDVER